MIENRRREKSRMGGGLRGKGRGEREEEERGEWGGRQWGRGGGEECGLDRMYGLY